ncbi:ClpP/crotonase-like domain-containing protein [Pilobolus umbonatus]|nr:ClpP/crotonase-like domain-containing protein [Pilobolus umbonatus]
MISGRSCQLLWKRQFATHHIVPEPSVLVEKHFNARHLIFNRPKRLNALDMEMVDIMYPHFKSWEQSSKVNAIFLEGKGRALCAGGDVKVIQDVAKRAIDPTQRDDLQFQIDLEYEMIHFIACMKTPYIAVMDGITMGAGGGLTAFAPFRIATENTQFAMPETAIGLFCDVGASFFLSRLDGHIGAYMGLTSRVVKAEDAIFSGIASHFVPSERLDNMKHEISRVERPDYDLINEIIEHHAADQHHTPSVYTLCGEQRNTIDRCFKHETVEEVISSLKEDGSKFAMETVDTIMKRSPTSVKITFEHLIRGRNMTLMDCLRMEHILWQKVPYTHDFVEGVSSHVVHKRQPQWMPSTLEEVDLDEDICVNLFNANVKQQARFLSNEDFIHHPYRKYSLPLEVDIKADVEKHQFTSRKETLEWFVNKYKKKFGIHQKIEDILNRQQ